MAVFWATVNRDSPHRSDCFGALDWLNDGHVYADSEAGWIHDASVSIVGIVCDSVELPYLAIELISCGNILSNVIS